MLKDKVVALARTLPQRPRSRLVPLPESADAFIAATPFGEGGLVDVLAAHAAARTGLPLRPTDFRPEQLSPHFAMNVRVVDEHGRQLGESRRLAELKASLGQAARSAFQALAALRLPAAATATAAPVVAAPPGEERAPVRAAARDRRAPPVADAARASYTAWTFGELPELMELKKGGQTLVGYPALIDKGGHVEIEVFDEPDVAREKHRAGLRRLVALQLRDALKSLEKSLPELQRTAMAYLPLGTADELRSEIVEVALDRGFLAEPLPHDAATFAQRIDEGRGRWVLIAQEVARLAAVVLAEWQAVQKKVKDARPPKDVADDVAQQLARLVPKRFVAATPWQRLQHVPRYLKAIAARLDKLRADPARDQARMAELRPLEQRWLKKLAERRGARDTRLDDFGWWLEELRVGLFAQELKTPQPVSAKRLDKIWAQAFA
jgi:ATP-dependent helicase HrpA